MQFIVNVTLVLMFNVVFVLATVSASSVQEATCPSCCQGPTGTPGIPGSNGNHGQHGIVGPRGDAGSPGEPGEPGAKGDIGSDGLNGEPGATGDHGLKGDQGVGQPGKQGPQGLSGMDGLNGERGEPGPAGLKGEVVVDLTRQSAFTAVRTSGFNSQSAWDPLPFEELISSEEGTQFNLENGTFTCTVPGMYMLMFSVLKQSNKHTTYVQMRKNNKVIVSGLVTASGYHQLSNSAVVSLQRGDLVYLALDGYVHSGLHHHTSFTGYLLH